MQRFLLLMLLPVLPKAGKHQGDIQPVAWQHADATDPNESWDMVRLHQDSIQPVERQHADTKDAPQLSLGDRFKQFFGLQPPITITSAIDDKDDHEKLNPLYAGRKNQEGPGHKEHTLFPKGPTQTFLNPMHGKDE